jgi:hypothetical protein
MISLPNATKNSMYAQTKPHLVEAQTYFQRRAFFLRIGLFIV